MPEQLRPVSKPEEDPLPNRNHNRCPVLILPTTAPLVGMPYACNLFRVRRCKTATETASQCTYVHRSYPSGTSVGASTSAEAFLNVDTLKIVVLGLVAFACGTFGGVMLGKIMCKLTGGKINPLMVPPVYLRYLWQPVFPRRLVLRQILPTSF